MDREPVRSNVIVRDAVPSDADNIAKIEELCFPIPWSKESILHDIEENNLATVLVAECDGAFAGYADIWVIAGEGQLNNIAVMPEMRGRHVGLAVMQELIARLEEAHAYEMSLEVREGNSPAINLYDRLGFEVIGKREGYYLDNGDNALIMKLDIEEE